MLYAGKTRAEIAGYDDLFTNWILCRRRDENGELIRHYTDLPRWVSENLDSRGHWVIRNPQPYSAMFHQVKGQQGLDETQRQQAWHQWRRENPGYGEGG